MTKPDLTKKNTYVFGVPAMYFYTIDADTEEEARGLLVDKGGIDFFGQLGEITHKDYLNATLEETWETISDE